MMGFDKYWGKRFGDIKTVGGIKWRAWRWDGGPACSGVWASLGGGFWRWDGRHRTEIDIAEVADSDRITGLVKGGYLIKEKPDVTLTPGYKPRKRCPGCPRCGAVPAKKEAKRK